MNLNVRPKLTEFKKGKGFAHSFHSFFKCILYFQIRYLKHKLHSGLTRNTAQYGALTAKYAMNVFIYEIKQNLQNVSQLPHPQFLNCMSS